MNDVSDLRTTLARHTDDLVDTGLPARADAVHARVATVRRRRRAAAAGALAAVVAAGVGVTLLPGGGTGPDTPAPADTVVGVEPPATLTSVGFDYRFAEGVDGADGRAAIRLERSDEPRLLSWATSGDDDLTVLRSNLLPGGRQQRTAADFGDWLLVPADWSGRVLAQTAEGDPGLAVYELGPDRPAGVTGAGLTYREDIAEGSLAGAVIGEPGQSEIVVDATATGPGARIVVSCTGSDAEDLYVNYRTVGDRGASSSGQACGQPLPLDGAIDQPTEFSTEPGQDLTTRFWLTDGFEGPRVEDPAIRLTGAVYALDEDPLGPEPTSTVEYDGHTWAAERSVRAGADGSISERVDQAGPALLGIAQMTSAEDAMVRREFGRERVQHVITPDTGPVASGVIGSGETASLEVVEGDPAAVTIDLTLYRPAD